MEKLTSRHLLLAASALATAFSMTAAGAQTAPPHVRDSGAIAEVVVTAQKKTENLQKAAISVEVLNSNQIRKLGIVNPVDLQVLLPAVRWAGAAPVIRGVGTYNTAAGVDPAIAYSYDGIYLSHYQALSPVLFDIQRVESVLGPQGTLYGRNSNGGVINFLTNPPTDKYEGYGSVTFGNYGTVQTEGMVNIPVTDAFAVRGSFGTNKHNSYTSDNYTNADDSAARVRLLYHPNQDLKVLLTVDGFDSAAHGASFSYCPPHSVQSDCAGVAWQPFAGEGSYPHGPGDTTTRTEFGVTNEIDDDLGWANLTLLTGYRTFHARNRVDSQGQQFLYAENTDDYFVTQEARLSSEASSKINWVTGLYYSHENEPDVTTYGFLFLPATPINPPKPLNVYTIPSTNYTSEAIFADVTYPILDNVKLHGGVRYTNEEKTAYGIANNQFPYVATPILTGASSTLDRFTWKGGLDYNVTPQNLLYATASSGFKSGGVNQVSPTVGVPTKYGPEFIVAEEIGTKNQFFDRRLQFNLSAFHYAYNGYQGFGAFVLPGAGFFFAVVNSQVATFWGGEAEAVARITPFDTIDLQATQLSAIFNQFNVPGLGDFSGNHAPDAPKFTYTLTYDHDWMLPNGADLTFEGTTNITAGGYTDITNNPGSYQNTYTRSGLNLSYASPDRWTVTAFVRNLENAGILSGWQGAIVPQVDNRDNGVVLPPRTFGLSVSKRF